MSYKVNPVIPILANCIIIVDINIFLDSLNFSFFSSSLYIGFITNIVAINTNVVNIYP